MRAPGEFERRTRERESKWVQVLVCPVVEKLGERALHLVLHKKISAHLPLRFLSRPRDRNAHGML